MNTTLTTTNTGPTADAISTRAPSTPPRRRGVASKLGSIAGFGLHAVAGVFVISSGLLMPMWAIVCMGAVWVLGLAIAIRHRANPFVVLSVPIATFAIWFLTASAGEAFLGWTG